MPRYTTVMALAELARGRCYFPSCPVPTAVVVEGTVVANLRPTPIRAAELPGARQDAAMTPEQRDNWGNLVLLCHAHHVWVGARHVERYTPEQLHEWKREREPHTAMGLLGLGRVTDDDLQRIIGDAAQIQDRLLVSAAARLDGLVERELADAVRGIDLAVPASPGAPVEPAPVDVPAPRPPGGPYSHSRS